MACTRGTKALGPRRFNPLPSQKGSPKGLEGVVTSEWAAAATTHIQIMERDYSRAAAAGEGVSLGPVKGGASGVTPPTTQL